MGPSLCFAASFVFTTLASPAYATLAATAFVPRTLLLEIAADPALDCANRVDELSERFAQATGATDVSVSCQGQKSISDSGKDYAVDELLVTYSAPRELRSHQIVFGGKGSDGQAGLVATYQSCLDLLATQMPLFGSATSRLAIGGSCKASQDQFAPGYMAIIESFEHLPDPQTGAKTQPPYAFTAYVPFGPDESPAYLKDVTAAEALALSKVKDVTIAYQDDSHIFFYSPYPLTLLVPDSLGVYLTQSQCTDQLPAASAIFQRDAVVTGVGRIGVSARCEPTVSYNGTPEWRLLVIGVGDWMPHEDKGADRQYSYTDCLADLPRIKANYEANSMTVFGAICEPDWRDTAQFEAHVFYDESGFLFPYSPPPPRVVAPSAAPAVVKKKSHGFFWRLFH